MMSMRTVNLEVANVSVAATSAALDWSDRVEALSRGEYDEEDFVAELWRHASVKPELSWEVAALLEQSFRRGRLPAHIFRSITALIGRRFVASEPHIALNLLRSMHAPATTEPQDPPVELPSQAGAPHPAPARVAGRFPGMAANPSFGDGAAPGELRVGSVLRDRYVIDSCIGRGGMGVVYKAIDEFRQEHGGVDCHVAIKVLHRGKDARPQALARLRCEFYCAQALSHQNVVNVFELDRDGELDFFTMEYLEGELLSTVMLQFDGQPLPRTAAWAIIRQIGEGIAHAHERNVVHADLKPQNIMLTTSGQVRILDFGASSDTGRVFGSTRTRNTNPLALTPAYASCELLAGKRADARDDLYALACLACELLAGQHPFWHQRSTEARMAQAVPNRPPNLTDRQWRTLQRGLAWDREQRSIPVREWLAALNPQPVTISSIPRPQKVDGLLAAPPSKLGAIRVIAALALFLACLCAWAIFNRSASSATRSAGVEATSPDTKAGAGLAHADAVPRDTAREPSLEASPTAAVAARAAGAPTAREKIDLASASYAVPAGAKFAEIRVRRNKASQTRDSFEWWTEDSSALPGVDFVTQRPAKVTFPPGSRTASLFVKLLDDAARKRTAKFDVVIGGASKGTLLGVSRAEVTLTAAR
jgi:serine/threonine protein kinase